MITSANETVEADKAIPFNPQKAINMQFNMICSNIFITETKNISLVLLVANNALTYIPAITYGTKPKR